jgi:CRP-like cAMP-binding protein
MKVNKEVYQKHVKAFGPGKTVFREKDPGNEMYVIIEGKVEIRKSTSSSASRTLIVLGKGDIFGEMAIIEKKKRSATAVTVTGTKLLVLNQDLFDVALGKNPDFARKMIRILSERLRRANTALQQSLMTSRQSMVQAGLAQYAVEYGESTFKGKRLNVDQFLDWASDRIGIDDAEIRSVLKSLLDKGVLEPSAKGGEELIFNPEKVIS